MGMLDRYRDASCLEFYACYDRFLKKYNTNSLFLDFFREKFKKFSNADCAYKDVILILCEYFSSEKIEENYAATIDLRSVSNSYRKIFAYCYCRYFEEASFPKECERLKDRLKNEERCFEMFNHIHEYKRKNKLDVNDKRAIDSIRFIQAFSKFIYEKRNKECVEYFKRFLFIYPFDKHIEQISTENNEWIEKHNEYLEILKKDKKAKQDELDGARNWYKEQLKQIDFEHLSEGDKSSFFKEAFVAFANTSSPKKGGVENKAYIRNLLYLGRYYNIHTLSLPFIKWKSNDVKRQRKISNLANYTWRTYCNMTPLFDLVAAKRKRAEGDKECAPDVHLLGERAKHFAIDEILHQESYGEKIESIDMNNLDNCFDEMLKQLPLPEIVKMIKEGKTIEEIVPFIADLLFQKSGLKKLINSEAKKYLNQYLNEMGKNEYGFLRYSNYNLMKKVMLGKSGIGLLTHYDVYKINCEVDNNNKVLNMIKEVIRRLI